MTIEVPNVTLNNGITMPQFGLGVWQVPDDEATEAVLTALRDGYRLIDTAAVYGNERGVGEGIRRFLEESGVDRSELFITTKLWNSDQGTESAYKAFDESLEKLGLDYVDLYLIHWPMPKQGTYVESWKALENIAKSGKSRAIGVCNFNADHLETLIAESDTVPAVNQIELHPDFSQKDLRDFDAEHKILTEAWSPLSQGKLIQNDDLAAIAETHGKSVAQIILRWHIQVGNVVIPKSVTPSRIKENLDIFDFELSDDEMKVIDGLEAGNRLGGDPAKDEF